MKIKKLATSLLLAACTFACACGSDKDSGGDTSEPTIGGVITEPANGYTYVEGTLHDVNVDFDAPVSTFVTNGQSQYKVVIGGSDRGKAAGLINEHVYKATGAELESINISDDLVVDENTQYIFVGCNDKFKELLGDQIPSYEEIGISGYQIITYGKNVFINAYSLHGYQMGVLAFLREVIGYDMLAEDLVLYEKDGKVMPEMNIVERPDFDFRQANSTSVSSTEQLGMGYTYVDPCINTGESWCHNIYDFVSIEEAKENPDWMDWLSNDSTQWQMCFTSRGNKDTYKKLVQHIADKLIGFLKEYPEKNTIILGQHDIGGNTPMVQNCKCTACMASYDYYGGTMGGAWLSLCNRASVLVDEYLQSQEAIDFFGGVKDWNLLQLVYHTHVGAPVEKDNTGYVYNENGVGTPKVEMWFNNDGSMQDWEEAWSGEITEETTVKAWSDTYDRIYTAPNVNFMFATSAADWTHTYYESQNAAWSNIAKAWAGVGGPSGGGEFFVWAYTLNSKFILYPYNSFDTSWETTRYFKQLGAKYIFWQGQYQNKNNAGFTKLKNYLDSKVEFDVNADYQYYVDKFFANYYGPAGEIMQSFFEQAQAQCRYIEEVNGITGNIHNTRYGNKENWPEGLVNTWMGMMEDAYDKIEQTYKITNPDLYELYTKHVMIEEQFPMIILCTTYADSYTDSDLKALRSKFYENFYVKLGNKVHAESVSMEEITNDWDLG